LLVQAGRHPQEVKRSLMTQLIFGGDDAELARRLRDRQAETLIANGLLVGRSSALVDQIGKWAEAGVERFMLQWLDLDDIAGLEAIARDVLPHFHQ
jgi:alkanesulfonate monooxygenase SsuD/methylene tetrahydromethanopterin reductase-like flavin-dependent oxidoreductase (luciferase family)